MFIKYVSISAHKINNANGKIKKAITFRESRL